MALCCCFFVSLKIPSSVLVIHAVGEGRESRALGKALVVPGRAPLPWHGAVEGQGAVGGQSPMGAVSARGFPGVPAPALSFTGTAGAHEGTGLSWLSPGLSRRQRNAGRPRARQGGQGCEGRRVRLCSSTQAVCTGAMQQLRRGSQGCSSAHAISRELLALPAVGPCGVGMRQLPDRPHPRGLCHVPSSVWSQVPHTSLSRPISAAPFAQGLTHRRACPGCLPVCV